MKQRTFTDQLGNEILIPFPPQRIISLVPSQTELLFDLGLDDQVVGITKFCIHPGHWRKTKTSIGGTKKFNFELIHSLKPDLIIGNKEENYQEGIETLAQQYPVWMSDIVSLQDALNMITKIGDLTDHKQKAEVITSAIRSSFSSIGQFFPKRCLYLIWKNPWMGAASSTFIHEMISLCGLQNCLVDQFRYPELTSVVIRDLNPEVIFLSSEPYPFHEKHITELQTICPQSKILLVDGEMFSWYGSRLLKFPSYLESIRKSLP